MTSHQHDLPNPTANVPGPTEHEVVPPPTRSRTACVNDDPTDLMNPGCLNSFPNKDSPGLCARCLQLKNSVNDAEVHSAYKKWIQCTDCSAIGPYFDEVDRLCGGCKALRHKPQQQASMQPAAATDTSSVPAVNRSTTVAMQMRMQSPTKPRITPTLPMVNNRPSLPLTTQSLAPLIQSRSAALSPEGRQITINCSATVSTSRKQNTGVPFLGCIIRSYTANTSVDAIKDEIIKEWNTQWEKHAEQSLEPDDCAIRILGGKELEPNTEHGTIGNLYDRHDQVPHRQSYFPKSRKGDPPNLIHLEVYIDIRKFESRTSTLAPSVELPRAGGGKRRAADRTDQVSGTKRLRASGAGVNAVTNSTQLTSRFQPRQSWNQPAARRAQAIALELASIKISAAGECKIDWSSASDVRFDASIEEEPRWKGKTKYCYEVKLNIGGKRKTYVAKRFFNLGDGPDVVTPRDNTQSLHLEVERAKIGAYMLREFYDRAEMTNTEVALSFEFTDVLLAREVVDVENGVCGLQPQATWGDGRSQKRGRW